MSHATHMRKAGIAPLLAAAALVIACAYPMAARADERMIVKKVVVKAPVEQVWEAWTTTEGIKTFFAPDAKVEARPEGPFEIYINPYAAQGLKGADTMRVLAVQPQQLLSFTWNAPPALKETREQRTVVILRFKPVAEGTEVTLTHVGWGDGGQWDQTYDYFNRAWTGVMESLQKRFVDGPKDWTDWMKRMKEMSEKK